MSCCNMKSTGLIYESRRIGYNTASGMSCCNNLWNMILILGALSLVTIPQAVWAVATSYIVGVYPSVEELQYRKRYELLQRSFTCCWIYGLSLRYNTASGMSCCNMSSFANKTTFQLFVTIPQAVWAVATGLHIHISRTAFNSLQYRKRYELLQHKTVLRRQQEVSLLQYRKRYELLQPTKLVQRN